MNKRSLIILALVLGIGGVVVVITNLFFAPQAVTPAPTTDIPQDTRLVSFVSPDAGEAVEVRFAGTVAILNGLNFENLVLTEAVSASGARYINDEEAVVLSLKGDAVTIEQAGTTLFTGANSEAPGVAPGTEAPQSAEATPAEQLLGTWVWQRAELNDGSTITPNKPGAFMLTFDEEGRMSGTTDCNSFSGAYTVADANINVGALASTKMYCEGSQEAQFVQFFSTPEGTNGISFLFSENDELIINLPFDSGAVLFKRDLEERV